MDRIVEKAIKQIVGDGHFFSAPASRLSYSYDATGEQHLPQFVVLPQNDDQVVAVLKVAQEHNLAITPRGGGVGYSGGAIPLQGGIVMAFTQMNRILSIDAQAMSAEVEPGVITYDLARRCEEMGLFYPPDPASLKNSTIGGNVAENAGGPRCFKYGVTARYVLRLQGFLLDGTPFSFGALSLKDVAGYAIKDLLVGSEGTLAIITRITVRLLPLPPQRCLWRLDFSDLHEAALFLRRVVMAGISPSALEFMDRSSLLAAYEYLGQSLPAELGASLLLELDGQAWEIAERGRQLDELLLGQEIIGVLRAEGVQEMEQLWQVRRSISPAISKLRPKKINEDVAVPPWLIPQAVEFFKQKALEHNIILVLFGHFGDGNIHTNLLVDPADEAEMKRAEALLLDIFTYVISIGGTLSGEHGIGISKKPYMKLQFSADELMLMKRIKAAFDPQNRLNPGKIFD